MSVGSPTPLHSTPRGHRGSPGPSPDRGPTLGDDEAAGIARALAHPVRIRILRILGGRGTCWCGDLCAEFPLAQSTVSQHLKILREAGLVRATPCGTAVGYAVDPDRLAAWAAWTDTLFEPPFPGGCEDSLYGEDGPGGGGPDCGEGPGSSCAGVEA